MHEAQDAVLNLAFEPLELHRVMVNHLPRNRRSALLLARLGFEREGVMCTDDRWQDRVLTARIDPREWEAAPAA